MIAKDLLIKVKEERLKRRFIFRQLGPRTWVEEEVFDKKAKNKNHMYNIVHKRLKIEDNAI